MLIFAFTFFFISSLYTTFVSVFLFQLKMGVGNISIIQSLFFAGYIVGGLSCPLISSTFSQRHSIWFFSGLHALSMFFPFVSDTMWVWMLTRFISGIAVSIVVISIESWFLSTSDPKKRGRVLSKYMIAMGLAQGISQIFILNEIDQGLVYYLIALVGITLSPFVLRRHEDQYVNIDEDAEVDMRLKGPLTTWIVCLLSGMLIGIVFSLLPIYSKAHHLNVSFVMTASITLSILLQPLVGRLSDRIAITKLVSAIGGIIMVGFFVAAITITKIKVLALIALTLSGAFCFTLYPVAIASICRRLYDHEVVHQVGKLLAVYSIGSSIGPGFAFLFIMQFGYAGIAYALSGICGFIVLSMLVRMVRISIKRRASKTA